MIRQHLYVADCREQAESATGASDAEAEKQLAGELWVHVTYDQMLFTYFCIILQKFWSH